MIVLLEYNNDTTRCVKNLKQKKFIKFIENLTVANYSILYEKIDLCTKQLDL